MANVSVDFIVEAKPGTAEIVRTLSVGESSVELSKELVDKLGVAFAQDQSFHASVEAAEPKKGKKNEQS